jgi:hypothetical protein
LSADFGVLRSVVRARSRIPEFQTAVARVAVELADAALSRHFRAGADTTGKARERKGTVRQNGARYAGA